MRARRRLDRAEAEADPLGNLVNVLDQRPILVAVAGPNGAGKTTFYHSHLKPAGLRFLNADEISHELEIG